MVTDSTGVVSPENVYTKDAFCKAVNWRQHAWRKARRDGLKVVEIGGRLFVRGSDFAAFLDRMSEAADA